MQNTLFTKPFSEITKDDAATAGGKGASLGEMTRAGIPVPPGFVILSIAFEQFLEETDLSVEIDAILETVNHQEMHTVEHASEKIQALVLSATMPPDIATEISGCFRELNAEYVAVRSSATAEDSASAAWAGQLDSYLNTTESTLLKNVQRCFASLFTPRAIFYRFENQLHDTTISVAVVIQKMVESESAGIAFSVHPVTEDRNQLIIEAGWGLGEAVVSGALTPDSYVVEKEPKRILHKQVHHQTRGLFKAEGGGNEWCAIPDEKGASSVLDDAAILELADLIMQIESHYGFPCDIEWARESGAFYIVQSRPITTLLGKHDTAGHGAKSVVFEKSYSRDTSLFVQGLWAQGLDKEARRRFGWENPHVPFIAHFVNNEVVEIWEHKKAIAWFLDMLHAENAKGPAFLENLLIEYKALLASLKEFHNKEWLTSDIDRDQYSELVFQAAFIMTLFFYTGMDERSPEDAKAIAVHAREEGDFFADNDEFARKNIAHSANISEVTAGVVLPGEFNAPPSSEVLTKRLSAFLVVDGTDTHLGTLSEYEALYPKYHFQRTEIAGDVRDITGQIAHKGHVEGVVRIVRKKSDMANVQKGNILVSPMTTPDFLPAMQNAAAFVTDEGGVTCHAAIVAREMQKPCIIGTQIATQVLHDGDLVEVDANNGVVRILERAK